MSTPWYATWFNTEFYHDLYRHRDEHETRLFIVELCNKLGVQDGERAMDMACGRGRHAKVLSEQGLHTLGVDLSPENISSRVNSKTNALNLRSVTCLKP